MEQAFDLTVTTIQRDWHLFIPEVRRDIADYITRHGLDRLFTGLNLQPDERDLRALKIPWDVADILYAEARSVALAECRDAGVDLERSHLDFRFDLRTMLDAALPVVIRLLTRRVEVDAAVVTLAGVDRRSQNGRLQRHLHEAWWPLADGLRAALRGAFGDFLDIYHDHKPVPFHQTMIAEQEAIDLMAPFADAFASLQRSVGDIHPGPDVYNRVRQLLEPMSMTTITITGDGNVVGNNNVVITRINRDIEHSHGREVAEAFAMLKGELMQMNTPDDKARRQALRAVEDAEDETADAKGDPATISDALQRAKQVLERSGAVFDASTGWGQRFVAVAHALATKFPGAFSWASSLGALF